MSKSTLTFYTNIPTPYQFDFFDELSKLFQLRVVFYAATEAGRQWEFKETPNYEIIVLEDNWVAKFLQRYIFDFHFSWSIFKQVIKDPSEQVVVGGNYWIPNGLFALVWSKFKQKKVSYFTEPLFISNNPIKNSIKTPMVKLMGFCCDFVMCVGQKAIDSLDTYIPAVPKINLPYNINTKLFAPNNLDSHKLTAIEQQIRTGKEVLLLTSGSLVYRKGMDVLIRAIHQLPDATIKLLIIGDGPLKEELKSLANGDSRIIFKGFLQKEVMPYYFSIADIFVSASRYDGWGVVINEAIAAGLPVISSDAVGAAIDRIKHGENGLLCRSENIVDFVEAIKKITIDKEERNRITAKSKELIQGLSSEHNAKFLYDRFSSISK